jgi:hypothetical protein
MRESWADAPMVVITLPGCPWCGAVKPILVRSEDNGDGSVTRKVICRQCSGRFKIVVELPEIGNEENQREIIQVCKATKLSAAAS